MPLEWYTALRQTLNVVSLVYPLCIAACQTTASSTTPKASAAPLTSLASTFTGGQQTQTPPRASSPDTSEPLAQSGVAKSPGVDGSQSVPPELACLARYYTGRPVFAEGEWWLELGPGKRLQFDDHKTKSSEERIAHPDLQDMFYGAYSTAEIAPIVDPDEDPGRYRVDELFLATYGDSPDAVRAKLRTVTLSEQHLPVHERAESAFKALAEPLTKLVAAQPEIAPILQNLGGTFNWRNIAGTEQKSAHSFGVSLDVNTQFSDYWRWQQPKPVWRNRIPKELVALFEAHGFIWGGRWFHYDTMHFEYRPELLDPTCRSK
ncbi:MAG TPA: M15 family metallopeptidase [Polyangiaceae bacterium]|jgi:hypothetical protein|nr:M15 family metallopeptidase [Polyangiaceae bacterium]